jgi:hypothetical protein
MRTSIDCANLGAQIPSPSVLIEGQNLLWWFLIGDDLRLVYLVVSSCTTHEGVLSLPFEGEFQFVASFFLPASVNVCKPMAYFYKLKCVNASP